MTGYPGFQGAAWSPGVCTCPVQPVQAQRSLLGVLGDLSVLSLALGWEGVTQPMDPQEHAESQPKGPAQAPGWSMVTADHFCLRRESVMIGAIGQRCGCWPCMQLTRV